MWAHRVTSYHQDMGFSLWVGGGELSRKRTWPPLVSCGAHDRERGESVKTWGSSMPQSGGGNPLMYSLRFEGISSTPVMGPMMAMATPLTSSYAHHAPPQCEGVTGSLLPHAVVSSRGLLESPPCQGQSRALPSDSQATPETPAHAHSRPGGGHFLVPLPDGLTQCSFR